MSSKLDGCCNEHCHNSEKSNGSQRIHSCVQTQSRCLSDQAGKLCNKGGSMQNVALMEHTGPKQGTCISLPDIAHHIFRHCYLFLEGRRKRYSSLFRLQKATALLTVSLHLYNALQRYSHCMCLSRLAAATQITTHCFCILLVNH